MQEDTQKKEEEILIEREFFFPTHGKTVTANSKEEAEKKVQELSGEELDKTINNLIEE